jgi:hypothetical protein
LIKAAIGDDSQLISDPIVTLVKANDLITRYGQKPKRIFSQLLFEDGSGTKLGYLRTNSFISGSDLSEFVLQSALNLSILVELILQINIRQSGSGQD